MTKQQQEVFDTIIQMLGNMWTNVRRGTYVGMDNKTVIHVDEKTGIFLAAKAVASLACFYKENSPARQKRSKVVKKRKGTK